MGGGAAILMAADWCCQRLTSRAWEDGIIVVMAAA